MARRDSAGRQAHPWSAGDRERGVTVEIASADRFASLGAAWNELARRAVVQNVSMHPAVARAAQQSGATVCVLLAWQAGAAPPRLVGAWVLAVDVLSPRLRTRALHAPVDRNLMLGTPVIDGDFLHETLSAMLDTLAAEPALPDILYLTAITGDGPLFEALQAVLAERAGASRELGRLTRPKLQVQLDAETYLQRSLSRERRHQLRRRRRRLAERGRLELTLHHSEAEVGEALEEFLALEASGWKGRAGSALIQRGAAAVTRVRGIVAGLAREGLVTIMVLRLNGRAAASQIVLRCGSTAYTWKCAYDEALRAHAPGVLLMEDVTRALLADRALRYADFSSNQEFSQVSALGGFWTERLAVADLLIALRPARAIDFELAALGTRGPYAGA